MRQPPMTQLQKLGHGQGLQRRVFIKDAILQRWQLVAVEGPVVPKRGENSGENSD